MQNSPKQLKYEKCNCIKKKKKYKKAQNIPLFDAGLYIRGLKIVTKNCFAHPYKSEIFNCDIYLKFVFYLLVYLKTLKAT